MTLAFVSFASPVVLVPAVAHRGSKPTLRPHYREIYSRETHANTIADALVNLIMDNELPKLMRANLRECIDHAKRDRMRVSYSAQWPAHDGRSWQLTLRVQTGVAHNAARARLIINADQYTALVSVLTDMRVAEVRP